MALERGLREVGAASVPVACSFPAPGLVEQDPEAIAESARAAIAGALGGRDEVAAIGIANQTETFVVWDRATGRAVRPAIVWQDRRTDASCVALGEHARLVRERTGLELDATFPATKLRWVLDRADGERRVGKFGARSERLHLSMDGRIDTDRHQSESCRGFNVIFSGRLDRLGRLPRGPFLGGGASGGRRWPGRAFVLDGVRHRNQGRWGWRR